jgi:hypothetical protein
MARKSPGFFQSIGMHIRLVFRLLADPRVFFLWKLLPVFTLIYLVFPEGLLGPLDDGAVLWVGFYLFIELCPPEVVAEHWRVIEDGISPASGAPSGEVVEGEFREVKQEEETK